MKGTRASPSLSLLSTRTCRVFNYSTFRSDVISLGFSQTCPASMIFCPGGLCVLLEKVPRHSLHDNDDESEKKRENEKRKACDEVCFSFFYKYRCVPIVRLSSFTSKMSSTYKLHYFNGRGRAEVSRLLFAAAGEKFEDIRFEHSEWPAHKAEAPLGQVPVLEYNGTKLPQSAAIARFLAKQFNLAGKNNFEQAQVDAVADTINDAVAKYVAVRRETDEAKQKDLSKQFFAEELPKHLANLEVLAKLYSNGGAFFVGNQLTWADLLFYDVAESMLNADDACLNKFAWLKRNREEVEKQPKIAEYLKNRPKTAF